VDGVGFTTLLFPNNWIIIAESEDKLQEAVYKLSQTVRKYNPDIFSEKTKEVAFAGIETAREEIIVDG
jgi:hypothetical protein